MVVTDSFNTTAKEMWQSSQEGFIEVRMKLDSIYNVVSRRALESAVVQEFATISIEPWGKNVQDPLTAIEAGNKDLNFALQQLQNIAVDVNKISTQTLVHMQRVANQELDDRQKELSDLYLRSQTEEEPMKKEVEEL